MNTTKPGADALVPTPSLQTRIRGKRVRGVLGNWQLYVLLVLPLLWLLIFRYVPMYGVQIAFRRYNVLDGFWGSPWVGLDHFRRFFSSYLFWRVFNNTILIALYSLVLGFPAPIILALALHHTFNRGFKKTVQMVSYAPYFISTVVVVGMLLRFLSTQGGVVNNFIGLFGAEAISFMSRPEYFKMIFVASEIWQNAGYGAIVFLAALSGIDPQLHEAAIVDGATKFQRILRIDLPGLLPTMVIMLILRTGQILNVGFEKILLMQNSLNLSESEVIRTYVYKVGIASEVVNFSYATAIGLFRGIISLLLILAVNQIAKKVGETSLW